MESPSEGGEKRSPSGSRSPSSRPHLPPLPLQLRPIDRPRSRSKSRHSRTNSSPRPVSLSPPASPATKAITQAAGVHSDDVVSGPVAPPLTTASTGSGAPSPIPPPLSPTEQDLGAPPPVRPSATGHGAVAQVVLTMADRAAAARGEISLADQAAARAQGLNSTLRASDERRRAPSASGGGRPSVSRSREEPRRVSAVDQRPRSGTNASASGSGYSDSGYSSYNANGFNAGEGGFWAWIRALQYPQWLRKMSPRRKQMFYCILSEAIVILTLVVQLVTVRRSIHSLLLETAERQVNLMDVTYTKKIDMMGLGFRGLATKSFVQEFASFADTSAATAQRIQDLLHLEATDLKLEVTMLLDTNATVLADAYKNRTGEYFDPDHVVSRTVREAHRGQLHISRLMSWETLKAVHVPVYRETVSGVTPNDFTHPYDTGDLSLMRYVSTPVWFNGSLAGVLLAGGITNGKTPITYSTVHAYRSGFAGVYTKNSRGGYIRSSSTTFIQEPEYRINNLPSASYDAVPTDHELLKRATQNPNKVVSQLTQGWALAAKVPPSSTQNTTALYYRPKAVAVRGVALKENRMFMHLLQHTWFYTFLLFVINLVAVYVSLDSFIRPLERVAYQLKKNKKVDLSEIGSVKLYASYLLRTTLTVVATVVCVSMVAYEVTDGMSSVVSSLATSELGVTEVTWNYQIDQMSQGLSSQAASSLVRELLASPNNPALYNETITMLQDEQASRKVEFYALVDVNSNVIASASHMHAVGSVFNPSSIASKTISDNEKFKITGYMPYADYMAQSPPIQNRHLLESAPDSGLTVYATKSDAIVRWASAPVFLPENKDGMIPDGVLISGDVTNGKTSYLERAMQVLESGYLGLYAHEPGTTHYALIASIYRRTKKGDVLVDIPVPNKVLDAAQHLNADGSAVTWSKLRGQGYAFAARSIPADRYVSTFGDTEIEGEGHHRGIILIYGKPRSTTAYIERIQAWWLWTSVALQFLVMALMNYSAYAPLAKLRAVLEEKGFCKRSDRPTILQVCKVYFVLPIIWLYQDLASRSLCANVRVYIVDPFLRTVQALRNAFTRLLYGRPRHRAPFVKPLADEIGFRKISHSGGTSAGVRVSPVNSITEAFGEPEPFQPARPLSSGRPRSTSQSTSDVGGPLNHHHIV